jgi:hypothetical protein
MKREAGLTLAEVLGVAGVLVTIIAIECVCKKSGSIGCKSATVKIREID